MGKWLKDFCEAGCVTVERYASVSNDCLERELNGTKYWLHGFGDATKRAYCAVVYLATIVCDKAYVKLVASKTRVAPIKELSIPRLELMAARILAQLMDAVRQALESEYEFEGVRYWTYSKTVLCWVSNPGSWKQFLQHRVGESKFELYWGHCPGIETWPSLETLVPTMESKVEEKKSFSVNLLISVDSLFGISNLINLQRFSCLNRLLRVTAWIKWFINNLKRRKSGQELVRGALEVSELKGEELAWVKTSQLVLKEQAEYKQLQRQFGLVESDEILNSTGRLSNSELDTEAREPIALPRKHRVTELVITQCRVSHAWGCQINVSSVQVKILGSKGQTRGETSDKCMLIM